MKYTVKTGGRIFGIKFSRPFSYPRLSPFMRFHIGPVYQISATVTVSWDTLYEAMDTGAGDWHKVFGLSSSLLSFSRKAVMIGMRRIPRTNIFEFCLYVNHPDLTGGWMAQRLCSVIVTRDQDAVVEFCINRDFVCASSMEDSTTFKPNGGLAFSTMRQEVVYTKERVPLYDKIVDFSNIVTAVIQPYGGGTEESWPILPYSLSINDFFISKRKPYENVIRFPIG